MLRKSTMLALTALAALGLAMTNASAKPGGPGFGPKGPGFNPGINKPIFKPVNKPFIPVKPIFVPNWHKPHPHPIWVHHRPRFWYPPVVVGGPAVVAAPTYAVSRPVAGPCTCLSKEYTPEGAVLFKDRCTNEMAMNPPPAPQQTGEAEVQQQTAQYQQQYVQPQPQAK
ncbi:hypothetical protein [Rhodoplanes sp. Z2-YC6860]|uniref:hypothetical protein n=1 Tax=Rhodoplanes sp. Z2-YC6860 TaxID=674703 RepID=UPI00082C8D76|nr:hypothetical protein [Rhodoplanes sp. Z2-YC6860]